MFKYKDLLKNIGILTLSNFGSKLLSFFLVPLYTALLTTSEYGEFDIINTTISLLIPVLSISISDAMVVFLLEKKYNKKEVCSIGTKIILISIIFVIFPLLINYVFNIIPSINTYSLYFLIMYILSVFNQFFQYTARGMDKIKVLGIHGLVNSFTMIVLNILFLLFFGWGVNGYFLAYIISLFISNIYLFVSTKINRYICFSKTDNTLKKEMIKYSKPYIFNSIGWWINNVSDRYIVTYMCGLSENGIYSIAYKIPSILTIIQSIFNQAWIVSTVKNYKSNKNDNFIKNIYMFYNIMLILGCSLLIIFDKLIANILYMNDFYIAWRYAPFLLIATIFSSLSGFLGGIFSAEHDSKIISKTTIIGACINIIFNIVLIYTIGAIGAAISTMISCFIVLFIRIINIRKYINFSINIFISCINYLILVVQSCLLLFIGNEFTLYIIETILLLILILLNINDIKNMLISLKDKIYKRKVNV